MLNPLVSIIIPCYNAEKWISEAIHSALKQTYSNKEIIVVDDGSTDSSLSIIRSFDDKILFCTGKNQGGCAARNKGLSIAKGELIQFLDADDALAPDKIRTQVERLSINSYAIATAPYRIIGSKGGFLREEKASYEPLTVSNKPFDWLVEKLRTGSCWATLPHCFLVPRRIIDSAGLWDESLSINQDGEFFSRILLEAKSVEFVPEAMVFYRRQNTDSVSNLRNLRQAESAIKVCKLYSERLLRIDDALPIRRVVKQEYLKFISTYYPQYPHLIAQAIGDIHSLGFKRLGSDGGAHFRKLCKLVGFMNALRIRAWLQSLLSFHVRRKREFN